MNSIGEIEFEIYVTRMIWVDFSTIDNLFGKTYIIKFGRLALLVEIHFYGRGISKYMF